MTKFTEAQIDAFIKEEAPYHETLTRDQAVKFMQQRATAAAVTLPPKRKPAQYEDQYGNMRWSDNGSRVCCGERR